MTIPTTSSTHESKQEKQDDSVTSSSSSVKPLPLTQALHANLSLLLRNLGNLLSYQAHLRYNNTSPSSASPQSIQSLPGWNNVARAALKWQADVTALHRWTKEAQEALAVEHTKAKAREAKEEEERQRKLGEEEKAAAAAAAAKEAEKAAAAEEAKPSTTTSSSAAPSRPESKGGDSVIDLTADEDEDDSKPLASKAPKRPAEDSGGAAPDDDASIAKKPKLDAASADTSAPGTGADSSSDAVSALLTSVNKGADTSASTTAPAQAAAPVQAPLDMSSMGLGDLSGVDFSAFMNMDGMGGGNAANNPSSSGGTAGGAPDLSSMSDLDFASFTDNTNFGAPGGGGSGMGSFDAGSAEPLTGGAAGGGNFNFSQDPSQGGLDMDFGAALEGVDWSSLIGTFGDGQQGGSGGGGS